VRENTKRRDLIQKGYSLIDLILAARKETYSRFMQSKDETNTDILEEVK